MSIRLIPLIALGLLCLALASCLQQDSGDVGAAKNEEAQSAVTEKQPAKPRVIKANPVTSISKLVSAMNNGDAEAYELLLAPDAPAREDLLSKFQQFDPGKAQISLEDASIKSQDEAEAVVIYDLQITYSDAETKPEWETGEFTLRAVDGAWLIWDVT